MVAATTRRAFLSSIAGITAVGGSGASPASANSSPQIIFRESFESGASTKFGGVREGRAANPGVVHAPNDAADGEYMMRMGRVRTTETTSTIQLPTSDPFEISVSVAPLTRQDWVPMAELSLSNGEFDAEIFEMINDARGNRTTGFNGIELGNFKEDRWNHVQVRFEKSEGQVRVSYTINGDNRGETTLEYDLFGDEIALELGVWDPTVLWDDIAIIQNPNAASKGGSLLGGIVDLIVTVSKYSILFGFVLVFLLGFLNGLLGGASSGRSSGDAKDGLSRQKSKPSKSRGKKPTSHSTPSPPPTNDAAELRDQEVETNEYGELIDDE